MRHKKPLHCWVCKSPTKAQTVIEFNHWLPTIKQKRIWDVCIKCGEASINGMESMHVDKTAIATFLKDKVTKKQLHFIKSYLGVSIKDLEASLKLQKAKLKPLKNNLKKI